jgi:hypothetical protein
MVNKSAPELLPATNMVNNNFIPAAITSCQACFLAGSKSNRPLKIKGNPSPVTSH